MSDDTVPRVTAPAPEAPDNATVPRGGGAPITDDEILQQEHVVPEGELTVSHSRAAREAEAGVSPYPSSDPERNDHATLHG